MAQPGRIPRPLTGARNAARRLYEILSGVEQLKQEVARLQATVDSLTAAEHAQHAELLATLHQQQSQTVELLQLVHDDVPANRQRLWRIRETPEYAQAFEEPEPLVSVCIATYQNTRMLLERALPSVLAQTYERLDVVIVGDNADPSVERAIKSLGDPRVRYRNLPLRGPYPAPPDLWFVAGGPPSNEAMRMARGRWIAGMDDDDACRPDRVETLLRAARERDLEFCYGRIRRVDPDGSEMLLCEFPPDGPGKVGLQASIMHTDMRFVVAEHSDAVFKIPGDWSRVRRMIRLGVRVGMIDDVVLDYYPGLLWGPATSSGEVAASD